MTYALPRTLTLPSGKRVTLRAARARRAADEHGEYLFSDVVELFGRDVELVADGAPAEIRELPLRDFHVLRAVLTKAGLAPEEEIAFDCDNCGEALHARPSQGIETGPWEDGEATDPELDGTAPFGEALEITPIRLGRVREVRTVALEDRTVRQAIPLLAALQREPISVDEHVVRGMGVTALGSLTDPAAIARLLDTNEGARAAVADVFIEAHYSLRLSADVFCPKCKARNRVDAPFEREFEHTPELADDAPEDADAHPPLPSLDEFVERAHAVAGPLIAKIPGDPVELVVEAGTPDVDDGGEPLLGSYVPPPPQSAPVAQEPPRVRIYYRTFQRIEAEEGPFDWEGELEETIEHELEHHVYWLRGDDPMDAEEHAEIDREVVRVIGRGESTRRTLAVFGQSFGEFGRRAWPLILLAVLSFVIFLAESQCAPQHPTD